LQPALGAALNTTYLQNIQDQVSWASVAGIDTVLDMHNYGRYITAASVGSGGMTLGSGGLTIAYFNDVWRRIAQVFAVQNRVVGYEIMNEPHDLPGGVTGWESISQACVDAIRTVDSTTPIYVAGYNWSHVQNWALLHPSPWITGANICYVAHHYFDSESSLNLGGPAADSGYSQTYASCVADAVALGYGGTTGTPLDDPSWRPYSVT
jgi:aryl-phospho-beta-D-glucosidase BglC (GH1 family)